MQGSRRLITPRQIEERLAAAINQVGAVYRDDSTDPEYMSATVSLTKRRVWKDNGSHILLALGPVDDARYTLLGRIIKGTRKCLRTGCGVCTIEAIQ